MTVLDRRRRMAYVATKRPFDLLAGLVGLILTAPLMAVIAVAVRLDSPGPILFRQQRVGYRGRPFTMLKFRTMEHGADESMLTEHLQHLAALGEHAGSHSAVLRIDGDPRVTRVGRRLRRWSLDELPNLINVISGRMSLVGPRPLVAAEMDLLGDGARQRLGVKPGITGLAQVQGRDLITIDERTRLDLQYVEHCSIWLDVRILFETARSVFDQPGA